MDNLLDGNFRLIVPLDLPRFDRTTLDDNVKLHHATIRQFRSVAYNKRAHRKCESDKIAVFTAYALICSKGRNSCEPKTCHNETEPSPAVEYGHESFLITLGH